MAIIGRLSLEMHVHRFIYVSHAAENISFEALGDISAKSKSNNRRDDLTGVLLWADGAFIQLIEGPKLELDATISRIKIDTRHSGLIRLAYREVSEITCGDWEMGCFPMPTSGPQSAFFNASSVASVMQRFSVAPDAELDAFFRTFYQNNVDRLQPR